MADDDKTKPDTKSPATPLDGVAAATAVGFAVASEAMSMWFGVMAGVARASQDMLERHNPKRNDEQPTYAPEAKPADVVAKAAARTVFAEVERTARTVADATAAIIDKQTKLSAGAAAQPTPAKAETPQPATIIPLKPKAAKPVVADANAVTKPVVAVDAAQADNSKTPQSKKSVAAPVAAPAAPVAAKAEAPQPVRVMPADFRAPKSGAKPAIPDDFKQLPGVGPKLEQVLNGLGVWTFEQVAAWTAQEIAYVEDVTGLNGRIAQDKWLEQADRLAKGATKH